MIKKYLNTFLISFVILLIIIQYGLFAYFYYVKDFKSDNINQTQEVVETFKNDSNEKEKLSEFYVEIKGAVNSPGVFKVTSDNNFNKTFYYKDAQDGIISFELSDLTKVNTFTFNVYNTDKSGCSQKLNRTFYLTTPRLNEYYNFNICEEIPDYYMCQKFVTYEDKVLTDFIHVTNEYKDKKIAEEEELNKNFFEKLWSFIKDNKTIFITSTVVIITIGIGTVIIIKKKRKDIV